MQTHARIRRTHLTLLLTSLLALTTVAATASPDTPHALDAPRIDASVALAMAKNGPTQVAIILDLAPVDSHRYVHHPAAKTDVHPLVFELTMAAEAGSARLEKQGSFLVFHGRFNAQALSSLIDHADIVAVDMSDDPTPQPLAKTSTYIPCANTATIACFSNHLSLRVTQGGSTSRVAARSSQSAVFYTFSSANWEVVAKVLDGCAINDHSWVFAAGASTVSFTVRAKNHASGEERLYSSSSSGNPIIDTQALDCLDSIPTP